MSDLISRQALMKEFSDFVRASNNSDFAQTPTWNDAVSLVGSMPSVQPQPEEDCDTCKHGFFGSRQCDNCRMRYPSHYEREEEQHDRT